MKELIFAGALCLIAGSACAADDEPFLEKVAWQSYPSVDSIGSFFTRRTDTDFEGAVELICRIRDKAGHLKCQVIGVSPMEWSDGWPLRLQDVAGLAKAFDDEARLDMARTPGAHPGRLLHMKFRFSLE